MSDELLKLFKLYLHESAVSASNSNINHTQIKTQNQTINSAVDNFRGSHDQRIIRPKWRSKMTQNGLKWVKNALKVKIDRKWPDFRMILYNWAIVHDTCH